MSSEGANVSVQHGLQKSLLNDGSSIGKLTSNRLLNVHAELRKYWLRIAIVVMLVMMPMSFSVKLMLGITGITWINPALLVSLIVAMYLRPYISPISTLLVLLATFVSAAAAGFLFEPLSVYSIFREPMKIALCIVWFLVAKAAWETDGHFVEKWLSITVVLQLLIAVYLWLGLAGYIPLVLVHEEYVKEYQFKQLLSFDGIVIQRLLGTFFEGPPFGLFMFCVFVVLITRSLFVPESNKWRRFGIIASLVGVLGSFSDQVYLGFLVFLSGLSVVWFRKRAVLPAVAIFFTGMVLAVSLNLFDRLWAKADQIGEVTGADSLGLSGAGRTFHALNGIQILSENPIALVTGIGPGRYGEYIARAGFGPPSTTMQVTPLEWVVEFGLVGSTIILIWLGSIGRVAWNTFGWMGMVCLVGLMVANAFQATWKWEAWFFALAFLAARVQQIPTVPHIQTSSP